MDELTCLDCLEHDIPDGLTHCPRCGSERLRSPEDDIVIDNDEIMGEHVAIPAFYCAD